ncbi:MAG TPA: cutinase family protein [Mycobacterium sp.]|nr:cutinase family protein [Mycobacterium sp.]HQC78710.1 cutinase family protein [Mycobacterium sp.]
MRRMKSLLSALLAVTAAAFAPLPAAPANAANCSDAEVIFARGREEPPGMGRIGDTFFNDLRSMTPKSVGYYAVRYPADTEIMQAAADMSQRIQYMANNCPNTRLVIGGYSLGAAATDFLLGVPSPMYGYPNPLPLGMSEKVAAVVLFGNVSRKVVGPVSALGPPWGDKTIDQCTEGDPLCNGSQDFGDMVMSWPSHLQPAYIDSGLVYQAAEFAAARI